MDSKLKLYKGLVGILLYAILSGFWPVFALVTGAFFMLSNQSAHSDPLHQGSETFLTESQ